jgi:hypothetical protein
MKFGAVNQKGNAVNCAIRFGGEGFSGLCEFWAIFWVKIGYSLVSRSLLSSWVLDDYS